MSSHDSLLTEEGLLKKGQGLLGYHLVRFGPIDGLIIDDFFALGVEKISEENSFASRALAEARLAYQKHDLEGSPEKDIEAEDFFTAAGARLGLCLVGSPLAKRVALYTEVCSSSFDRSKVGSSTRWKLGVSASLSAALDFYH